MIKLAWADSRNNSCWSSGYEVDEARQRLPLLKLVLLLRFDADLICWLSIRWAVPRNILRKSHNCLTGWFWTPESRLSIGFNHHAAPPSNQPYYIFLESRNNPASRQRITCKVSDSSVEHIRFKIVEFTKLKNCKLWVVSLEFNRMVWGSVRIYYNGLD